MIFKGAPGDTISILLYSIKLIFTAEYIMQLHKQGIAINQKLYENAYEATKGCRYAFIQLIIKVIKTMPFTHDVMGRLIGKISMSGLAMLPTVIRSPFSYCREARGASVCALLWRINRSGKVTSQITTINPLLDAIHPKIETAIFSYRELYG